MKIFMEFEIQIFRSRLVTKFVCVSGQLLKLESKTIHDFEPWTVKWELLILFLEKAWQSCGIMWSKDCLNLEIDTLGYAQDRFLVFSVDNSRRGAEETAACVSKLILNYILYFLNNVNNMGMCVLSMFICLPNHQHFWLSGWLAGWLAGYIAGQE